MSTNLLPGESQVREVAGAVLMVLDLFIYNSGRVELKALADNEDDSRPTPDK